MDVVTGVDTRAAQNHSRLEHGHEDHHFDRAEEFIDLVRALWDSWEDDAFIRDKETGEFVDGSKIHHVNHDGKNLSGEGSAQRRAISSGSSSAVARGNFRAVSSVRRPRS